MKKKLLLVISLCVFLVMLFAISVSAETVLKSQDNNAYGELSFFDESITVGRTNNTNGFTPYIDADSTTYARVVMGDGTTFYTFPTAYILSEGTVYGSSGKNIYVPDFSSLNTAMQTATGTNPGWSAQNLYRIELPYTVNRFNGGTQNFGGYGKVVEIKLQPSSGIQDQSKSMMFWHCYNLETIHNLDTFVFRKGCLGGAFQDCAKLTNLTIGVSPEVTTTDNSTFSGCTMLQSVNFSDAFPNLTTIGKFVFSNCSALKTIPCGNVNQEGAVIISEGVTRVEQEAFYNCDSIKYLSLPSTITYLGPSIIRDSSGLEFVDFNENANAINLDNWGHFSNCTSLKAVSLPDGIETISNRFMVSCSNLQAVYLPANLEQMNTNGNGQGPFCFSGKMFFVQDAFEVRDEDGYFLGDNFQMPTKPEIYYMPENLSTAGGNASSGTWFRDCFALNNTIVMPEAFTESTVAQMFRGIASSTQRKNVVYRGKITNYCWSEMNKYINFVFAHPENTDISTINFTAFYNRNNEYCYFYFCSTGFKYTMAKENAAEVAATKEINSYNHVHNPKADGYKNATCENAAGDYQYCFCGEVIDFVQKGSDALGHLYNDLRDQFYPENNYYENATCVYFCSQCSGDVTVEDAEGTKLFTAYGYSASEDDPSNVAFIVYANAENIKAYSEFKAISVAYGLVVSANTNGTPLTYADGSLTESANTVKINMTGTDYNKLTVRVSNIGSFALHCNGYIVVGEELFYLNHATVDTTAQTITYAEMLELLDEDESETEEEIPEETPAE